MRILIEEYQYEYDDVKQFSLDMRNAFPGETGFSLTNVKNIKRWYLFYYEGFIKGHQPGDFLKEDDTAVICHQPGGFLKMPDMFGLVRWSHHVLDKY